jgi:putative GTP pyrophosphokinase
MPLEESERKQLVEELVATYARNIKLITIFQDQLHTALDGSEELAKHIHSIKARTKDPDHLAAKLFRKIAECEERGEAFDVTTDNLLTTVNDLAGVRVLHLYTRQIQAIDPTLRNIFDEQQYELVEGPFARTWDDEYREFFTGCGITTEVSPTMYTSVHYVVNSASRTALTCEIQVRTLMEEVWGEVDHALNYPDPTPIFASQEQIKVLARATSAATRLVDSIFLTHADAEAQN